jgi:prepilin-type N-terminal cleavage/methylation domain-containing protein
MKRGFTLIELLIVVAIIAILAAIAVPNFLEAQTRSKISRVKSDMRSLTTAIESYTVDWNNPPPEAGQSNAQGIFAELTIDDRPNQSGILTPAITTPVAYMTSFLIRDVFFLNDAAARPDVQLFSYQAYPWRWSKFLPTAVPDTTPIVYNENTLTDPNGRQMNGNVFREIYGNYRLFSVGPDRQWDNKPGDPSVSNSSSVGLPYDATNGTNSIGSILRSQKEPEQKTWLSVTTSAGQQ